MEFNVHISLSLLILLASSEFGVIVQARRIGGGGSIFSKPGAIKTPSRPPAGSRPVVSGGYSRPILTRNYGGYSGRQSSSGSGFGLGKLGRPKMTSHNYSTFNVELFG